MPNEAGARQRARGLKIALLVAGAILAAGLLTTGGGFAALYLFSNSHENKKESVSKQEENESAPATTHSPAERVPVPSTTPLTPVSVAKTTPAFNGSYPPARVTKFVHPTYQAWHYQIRFQPGYSGGVVKDSLPKLVRYYLVNGQAQQTLTISLSTPTENGWFNVLIEDGQRELVSDVRGTWTGVLPETGDYSIYVYRGEEMRGPSMPFEMAVSIK
jgi:hypothetical protein